MAINRTFTDALTALLAVRRQAPAWRTARYRAGLSAVCQGAAARASGAAAARAVPAIDSSTSHLVTLGANAGPSVGAGIRASSGVASSSRRRSRQRPFQGASSCRAGASSRFRWRWSSPRHRPRVVCGCRLGPGRPRLGKHALIRSNASQRERARARDSGDAWPLVMANALSRTMPSVGINAVGRRYGDSVSRDSCEPPPGTTATRWSRVSTRSVSATVRAADPSGQETAIISGPEAAP
jgi:hypothetical protein